MANQYEEVIKLLVDKIKEDHPRVASFLLHGHYVDGLGGNTPSDEHFDKLISESWDSLDSISLDKRLG